VDCAPTSPNCAQGYVSQVDRTHTYANAGTYTVKLSGGSNTAYASVTVTGGTSSGGVTAKADGLKVWISAPTVAQKMQECTYSVGWFGSSGNGLTVDWGDGVVSPVVNTSAQGQSCTSEVTAHLYSAPGTYTIKVRSWHPGPTDFPVTDWEGSTSVTVTGSGTPIACSAIAWQIPACPAGQHAVNRYANGCPTAPVCVPSNAICTAIGFVTPTCPAGQHAERQYSDSGCEVAPICVNGSAGTIYSSSSITPTNTSQTASALSALQAALEKLKSFLSGQ
ncbi:MAG TPA: hypothetical protein VHD38_02645, partial [Candidatus Paceibacterota bacterium]|nr:hypothetical protein [Candidatus Paceibacterota bacterium]